MPQTSVLSGEETPGKGELREGKKRAVAAGRGKGACASGGTVHGAAFGGLKIWNPEIWSLLAKMQFVCIFFHIC